MTSWTSMLPVRLGMCCVPAVRRIPVGITARRTVANGSYYHKASRWPLLSCTTTDAVERAAHTKGDTIAITSCHQGLRKTYAEYKKDIDMFAAGLVSLRLPVGSKLGILMPNMYEWAVVQFAAAKAGLVLVNINTALQVPELQYCLSNIECDAIVTSDQFSKQDYYGMLLQIVPELERSKPGQLKSSRLPHLKHVILVSEKGKAGTRTYKDIAESATGEHYKAVEEICSKMQFDAVVNVQFTSGTTGKPKGALLSHFNILNNAYTLGYTMGYDQQQDSICLNVPMIHCFGCVIGTTAALLFGSTVVMPAPSFNAKSALEAISTEKCTMVYGTPTMYIDMMRELDSGHYDVSSVSKGVMAGAPCPPEVIKSAMSKLNAKQMHIVYGTTECSPVITATSPNEPIEKWMGTVGRPLDHVEVKVVDREDRIVPLNTRGELCARGYLVFHGYFGDEKKTREVVKNNWYHTGDEAFMDKHGRVTITGRTKDVIVRGGENIYPREVEEFLYSHPDIQEVQVFGVPDVRLGEEVCAWIKTKAGKEATADDVKSFCKGKISHFKIPKYVLFVGDFPRTVSGKLQKFRMREESMRRLNLQLSTPPATPRRG